MDFQKQLLEEYHAVLFVEVDEILYPKLGNFEVYLQNCNTVRCASREVIQQKNEPPIKWGHPLLAQRNLWFHFHRYDKPLLSKVALDWEEGFHFCKQSSIFNPKLLLVHLRRIDRDYVFSRILDRRKWKWPPDQAPNKSWQWRMEIGFEEWYQKQIRKVSKIPQNYKHII